MMEYWIGIVCWYHHNNDILISAKVLEVSLSAKYLNLKNFVGSVFELLAFKNWEKRHRLNMGKNFPHEKDSKPILVGKATYPIS